MGLKCNIFIKAEYTTMFRRRNSFAQAGARAGHSARAGGSVDRPEGCPKVQLGSCPDELRSLLCKFNRFAECIDVTSDLHRRGHLLDAQFHTSARALVWAVLEDKDRHSTFFGTNEKSFALKKLFKQLGILGKKHELRENSLLSFVVQSTLSARLINDFFESHSAGLMAIQDTDEAPAAQLRMFWIVVWIFATTTTKIPATPTWYDDFSAWYDWKITGSKTECPKIEASLDRVLVDLQTRTHEFFIAVPDARVPTAEQVSEACKRLNIQAPSVLAALEGDDDGGDDGASVLSTASSRASSRGGDSPDVGARYKLGCASVAQVFAFLTSEEHDFFRMMTIPDLNRLVVSLLRRMLRRPKRFREFNFRLSSKLLRILNQHKMAYKLKLVEIALRICQATGSIALALSWHYSACEIDTKNVNAVNGAIQAAVVLMRLGNLPIVAGKPHEITPVANAIIDEAFSNQKMKDPVELVRKTFDQVKVEIQSAREGKWEDPSETSRRRPAASGGAAQAASSETSRPAASGVGVEESSSEASRRQPLAARGRGGFARGGGRAGSSRPQPTVDSIDAEIARLQAQKDKLAQPMKQ